MDREPGIDSEKNSIEHLGLKKGCKITLVKRHATEDSSVAEGSESSGSLVSDVRIGAAIELDTGARTTSVSAIDEHEGHLYAKTRTSIYEIVLNPETTPEVLTKTDLDLELRNFGKKNYGEWDMMNDSVPLQDNPYHLLFEKAGFKEGDEVEFFVEKVRYGRIETDNRGAYVVRDLNGNPWGTLGLLGRDDSYVKKINN